MRPIWLGLLLCAAPLGANGRFLAREWGVVELQPSSAAWAVGLPPRPVEPWSHRPGGAVVREPVVYIESFDKQPFSLRVDFPSGGPTTSFPRALTDSASLTWPEVRIGRPGHPRPVEDCDRDIVRLLGDEGADPLDVDGQASAYLYYEGTAVLAPSLKLERVGNADFVRNISGRVLRDVVVSLRGQDLLHTFIPLLAPGARSPLQGNLTDPAERFPSLLKLGFNRAEDAAFARAWRRDAFRPLGGSVASAFYQLSPDRIESVSRLVFSPAAMKTVRVMFVKESL